MSRPELRISVVSDYICPFCYIGSRRLASNLRRAQLGVTGVPAYVLGGSLLSGALDETTLRQTARTQLAAV